jgi:hypothetical protein
MARADAGIPARAQAHTHILSLSLSACFSYGIPVLNRRFEGGCSDSYTKCNCFCFRLLQDLIAKTQAVIHMEHCLFDHTSV